MTEQETVRAWRGDQIPQSERKAVKVYWEDAELEAELRRIRVQLRAEGRWRDAAEQKKTMGLPLSVGSRG